MPTNFDPQIASNPEDLLVIANIFDGLFEKRNGEIVYNLAESCDILSDGKTYTIKIKQGSVYHAKSSKSEFEGKAVTADDFVFALQRVVNPKMYSPYASDFSNIKNARSIINGGDVNSLGVYAKIGTLLLFNLKTRTTTLPKSYVLPPHTHATRNFLKVPAVLTD